MKNYKTRMGNPLLSSKQSSVVNKTLFLVKEIKNIQFSLNQRVHGSDAISCLRYSSITMTQNPESRAPWTESSVLELPVLSPPQGSQKQLKGLY